MGTTQQEAACRALNGCTLVFLHIPKAAGATLRRILFRVYGRSACHWIKPSGAARLETMQELREMSPARKREMRVVTGHMHVGTLNGVLPQPLLRVTILRDPAERVRSQYQYVRRLREHPHFELAQAGFEAYSEASSPALDNLQTRLLAGGLRGDNRRPVDRAVTEVDLDRALENLGLFAAVGVQERFGEAVDAMGRLLRWGEVPQVDDAHVEGDPLEIDARMRALLLERNRFDAVLHREAHLRQDKLEALADQHGVPLAGALGARG